MRNNIIIVVTVSFFVTIGLAVSLAGCDKTKADEKSESVSYGRAESDGGIIEIKEKMFLTQVNDVYLNADDYLGKTIKLEGIFKKQEWEEDTYCYVLRYGPGCCGDDGNVGFEVKWPEDRMDVYPDDDSWVAAAGVLKAGKMDTPPYQYLFLDLSSIDVLSKRGVETVRQ
jgi:uncharacterized membrane protein YcgQ (UPF0703/DUF1980 family)